MDLKKIIKTGSTTEALLALVVIEQRRANDVLEKLAESRRGRLARMLRFLWPWSR